MAVGYHCEMWTGFEHWECLGWKEGKLTCQILPLSIKRIALCTTKGCFSKGQRLHFLAFLCVPVHGSNTVILTTGVYGG